MVGLEFSWRKSSKTVLLHLGHLGSSSESITYMRHLGHPTRTMDVASGLFEYRRLLSSWLSSDDTQELGGDVGDSVADRLGESANGFALGGERFSFKSSFGPLPFLRLMMPLFVYSFFHKMKYRPPCPLKQAKFSDEILYRRLQNQFAFYHVRKLMAHIIYI